MNHGTDESEFVFAAGPFSHRVLLILEEKGIPYRPNYVEATQKPNWCAPSICCLLDIH